MNIAPRKEQVPVSFTSAKSRLFKNLSTDENLFNTGSKLRIMPPNYLHARLKCCGDSSASYPQYIFQTLDWTKRNIVASMVHFNERKQSQTDVTVGRIL